MLGVRLTTITLKISLLRNVTKGVGLRRIDLAQDRDGWRAFVNTIMNLLVPLMLGKFLSCCTAVGFSRRARLPRVSYVFIYTH
jgi:hypothetical protein